MMNKVQWSNQVRTHNPKCTYYYRSDDGERLPITYANYRKVNGFEPSEPIP